MTKRPRLALFEFSHQGHRPHYIKQLILGWQRLHCDEELAVVVTPLFAQAHRDVLAMASRTGRARVTFILTTNKEATALLEAPMPTGISTDDLRDAELGADDWSRLHWTLFNRYAKRLAPQCSLLMYLDAFILPMAMGFESAARFSGIHFRPSYHFESLSSNETSRLEKLQKIQEKFLLSRAFRHPALEKVFCLDPIFAHQKSMSNNYSFIYLPDPVRLPEGSDVLSAPEPKDRAAIDKERKSLLFFGGLSRRKGIIQLLDAVLALPETVRRQLCLHIVGTPDGETDAQIRLRLRSLQAQSSLQVVSRFEYVSDKEAYKCFREADIVLAPYQCHVGMSGVALLAAAHQKPILTQDYGLLGELARKHKLGVTVDTTDPAQIARGILDLLSERAEKDYDREEMFRFAKSHSAEKFAKTIFEHLL